MSVANLAMLAGNVGKESTGVNPLRGQNNVQGACDMGALPDFYPGYQRYDNEEIIKKFETAWKVEMPRNRGLTETEMIEAALDGRIRALYIVGENPMLSDPDTNNVEIALLNLELLVVQDIFYTETAKFANVVLPGISYAEKEGTFTNTERRVQRVRKGIEPIEGCKPDWWIISEIAKRMESDQFNYNSSEDIMKEIAELTPIYGGISHERLDNGEHLLWPCPTPDHPGTKFLHEGGFKRGKGKFVPVEYQLPAEVPDKDYPYILTTGRITFHYHTGTMTRKVELLDWEVPTGFVEISPEDAMDLDLKEGEMVTVKSRRGEIEIKALITENVPQGVVFIPFHFAECKANVLTNAKLDPKAKIPELKISAVNIIKKR
jgi:predicted molibdopterin-dependent oxidoreductase YjgC